MTDRAGWYEMKLPAGRYNVRVDGQSPYPAIPVPILVRPGKVDTIRIRMLSEKDAFAIRPRVIVSEDRRGALARSWVGCAILRRGSRFSTPMWSCPA